MVVSPQKRSLPGVTTWQEIKDSSDCFPRSSQRAGLHLVYLTSFVGIPVSVPVSSSKNKPCSFLAYQLAFPSPTAFQVWLLSGWGGQQPRPPQDPSSSSQFSQATWPTESPLLTEAHSPVAGPNRSVSYLQPGTGVLATILDVLRM